MNIDATIRTINLIVAPAVMVTSCTLFLNGLLQRYHAISSIMRTMHRERLDLLRTIGKSAAFESIDGITRERIREIERQLPSMLLRHNLIRNAVLFVNIAIVVFVLSMFIIAAANITNSSWMVIVALFCFLAGMGVLLTGVLTTTTEAYRSHRELTYEIQHGLSLGKE